MPYPNISKLHYANNYTCFFSVYYSPNSLSSRDSILVKTRTKSRSSHPEVFCKKGVLRNFAKFTKKHLCQSLFFNKVAGLRPATLLKRDSGTGFFL